MVTTGIVAAVGLFVGRGIRVLTPWLARVKAGRLPFRWPWLEVTSALSLGVVASVAREPPWFALTLLLLAITATDAHYKLIPNRVTIPGAAVGALFSTVLPDGIVGFLSQSEIARILGADGALAGFALAAMGASVGFLGLEIVRRAMGALVGMEVLGMGDSKLLLMIGAFLGPQMIVLSFAPALLFGLVIGGLYTKLAKTPHLPFGPALALGGYITMLFGDRVGDAWTALARLLRGVPPAGQLVLSLVLTAIAVALLLRVRRRRQEYTRQIEEEYERLEDRD